MNSFQTFGDPVSRKDSKTIQQNRDLNDLIGSRICHDLISPLGAIGNGVELLTLSGAGAAPEIALISESIENANARIRYFRVAFGAAPLDAEVSEKELRSILRDMFRGARLKVEWHIDCDLPRGEAKLAFLAVQCLESALPWGGKIRSTRTDDGHWTLHATGERLKFDDALWQLATDPGTDLEVSPSDVHFALVGSAAARTGRSLHVTNLPDSLTVTF